MASRGACRVICTRPDVFANAWCVCVCVCVRAQMHALAALLRGNLTITELVLRGNDITDEGARALAAVLAGQSAVRTIDLRANHIGRSGLKALAEGLERCVRDLVVVLLSSSLRRRVSGWRDVA